VGPATKLIEYIMDGDKAYRAEATLGVSTDSLDAEGAVVAEHDASAVTEEDAREAVAQLVGPQMMAPPMYSAARVNGKRLYDLARKGQTVERKARPVAVHSAELVSFTPGPRAKVTADIGCSKGTYVRVLSAQLGERLGVGAHLSFLVRRAVGPHLVGQASTLEELQEACDRGDLEALCVPPEVALGHLPEIRLTEDGARAFRQGNATACQTNATGPVRVHDGEGRLVGIGEVLRDRREPSLQPRKVLVDP
jgi:tRNA pseudouridine55 synthase